MYTQGSKYFYPNSLFQIRDAKNDFLVLNVKE